MKTEDEIKLLRDNRLLREEIDRLGKILKEKMDSICDKEDKSILYLQRMIQYAEVIDSSVEKLEQIDNEGNKDEKYNQSKK